MNTIKAKIEARLDALEESLQRQDHLAEDPDAVLEILASVSKFYSALSEEQRDFIQAARWAVEERKDWMTATA